MREFFFKSNNELPNSSVSIKEDSFISFNLQSVLFRVLMRVLVLLSNNGQWRKKWDVDSISMIAQLQRGLIQSGMDVGGCHCCQCSTPKWLTLIFRVEFSFLKMLRIRFSNLTKSSYGRHCSETLTSVGGYNFSCCPVFSTIRDSVLC